MTSPIPPKPPILRQEISKVYLHNLFFELSGELGYSYDVIESYLDDIERLLAKWDAQKYIEIYSENAHRAYGRAKDSNSAPGSSPWYIELYHARLLSTGQNDPLVVLIFEEENKDGSTTAVASIRFMADHDDLFGEPGKQKFNVEQMKAIRLRTDSFIKRGNRIP